MEGAFPYYGGGSSLFCGNCCGPADPLECERSRNFVRSSGVTGTIDEPQTTMPVQPSQEPANPDGDTNEPPRELTISSSGGSGSAKGTDYSQNPTLQMPSSDIGSGDSDVPSSNPGSTVAASNGDYSLDGEGQGGTSEYTSVFQKIKELNGKNPAQVKGVARRLTFLPSSATIPF